MIVVTGLIEVGAGSVEGLVEAARTMAAATREEAGCVSYAFYQDIDAPTRFRIFEEWESEAALAAHFKAPHMAAFNQAVGGAEIKSINIVKFEPGPATKIA